jgi:hypothetical protein
MDKEAIINEMVFSDAKKSIAEYLKCYNGKKSTEEQLVDMYNKLTIENASETMKRASAIFISDHKEQSLKKEQEMNMEVIKGSGKVLLVGMISCFVGESGLYFIQSYYAFFNTIRVSGFILSIVSALSIDRLVS